MDEIMECFRWESVVYVTTSDPFIRMGIKFACAARFDHGVIVLHHVFGIGHDIIHRYAHRYCPDHECVVMDFSTASLVKLDDKLRDNPKTVVVCDPQALPTVMSVQMCLDCTRTKHTTTVLVMNLDLVENTEPEISMAMILQTRVLFMD